MLSPEQVLPFLLHEDLYVREHAADYLADGYESTPQLVPVTADHFWESIDRYGVKKSSGLLARLRNVPQTDASLSRALATLAASPDDETDFQLQHAVGETGLELVRARREELLAAPQLLPRVRDHLAARLALAEVAVDDLWDQLLQFSDENKGHYYGEYDTRVAARLVEALARHGDAAAALAMKRLTSGLEWEWVELFAIQLLGELRYAPAIDLLLERLQVEDDDVTPPACGQALIQIGTDEIVGRLEAVCKGNRWDVRMDVASFLGKLKRSASEQALIRLLAAEDQEKEREERAEEEAEDVCATIGAGLCDLCTTDGLEALRQLILHERYDPGIAEVDEEFLTVCQMIGYEPPEAPAWRKVVAKRRAGREALLKGGYGASPMIKAMRERWRQGDSDWVSPVPASREHDEAGDDVGGWDLDPDAGAGFVDSDYVPPEPITPIRRDTPKVGRNDPCPCGSGKKYKKCCMNSTTSV